MHSVKKSNFIAGIGTYLVYIIVSVGVVFPILYVILSSFKTNMEIMAYPDRFLPKEFTVDNYIQAWNSDNFNVGRMLFNSLWFTCSMVAITLLTSSVSGYVFARGEFKLKKVLFTLFSSLMFMSLGSITIYPKFEILSAIGLNKSLWGLIVMHCFGIPVVNMYLVRSFVNTLPKELDDAARIDGCTFTGIFFRIILPLLTPVLATLALLSFQSSWNSYLMPTLFTMSRPDQQTLIVGIIALKNSGEGAAAWNLMFAATTIALLPVLVMYAACSRFFTQGITAGAVKG